MSSAGREKISQPLRSKAPFVSIRQYQRSPWLQSPMPCVAKRCSPASFRTPNRARALANEIVAWCVDRLAYYKAPGFVAFVTELPLTSTQKIQRGELRDLVASLAGTAHDTRTLKRRPA